MDFDACRLYLQASSRVNVTLCGGRPRRDRPFPQPSVAGERHCRRSLPVRCRRDLAVERRGSRAADGCRRRGDAPHRIGAVDHGVEAADGRRAAAHACRLARGFQQVQADPAICRDVPGHGPRTLPDDLPVGMDAPAHRSAARSRAGGSARVLLAARTTAHPPEMADARHLRPWRASGLRRLVDGLVGTVGARGGRAGAPCHAPAARFGHPDGACLVGGGAAPASSWPSAFPLFCAGSPT